MLTILVYLVLVGVGLYLVNTMVPMDGRIKTIINILVIIMVVLWLLDIFGLVSLGEVPRFRHR